VRSVCIFEIHFTVNDIRKMLWWRIYVASNYKTYLGLHVIGRYFCPT